MLIVQLRFNNYAHFVSVAHVWNKTRFKCLCDEPATRFSCDVRNTPALQPTPPSPSTTANLLGCQVIQPTVRIKGEPGKCQMLYYPMTDNLLRYNNVKIIMGWNF